MYSLDNEANVLQDRERILVKRFQQGDGHALASYFELNERYLLNYIKRNMSPSLAGKIEARDILQETVIVALNTFNGIDWKDKDPCQWLCYLAERRIIDAYRKHFRAQKRMAQNEIGLDAPLTASRPTALKDVLAASNTTPTQALYRDQKIDAMNKVYQVLTREQSEAFRLRYIDGLSTDQIAERFGKSNGAIRVMLSRTVAKLQRAFKEER